MSGIKAPIQDILTRLSSITPLNQDNLAVPLYARVWNGQIKQLEKGETYNFPLPAAFLELPNPASYSNLLNGIDEADIVWRVHIAHEFYDAADGTFDQDLSIFDLRDQVIAILCGFKPTGCGTIYRISEEQDYTHNNIYHYIIDFKSAFIDSTGSPFNSGRPDFTESAPPTSLEITIDADKGGTNNKIPHQPYRIQR